MLKLWIGNEFPIDLVLDLGNYTFYCSIFFFLYYKKYIDEKMFFILIILMLTPYLFNNSILLWTLAPDQSQYMTRGHILRNEFSWKYYGNEGVDGNFKVNFAGYLFALSPILNIETFKSVGFFNRFLLLGTSVFLLKKNKMSFALFLAIILSPSLTYFSSVTLKEVIVLMSMVWSVYAVLEKKYIFLIIPFYILFITKFQNLVLIIFFIFIYLISETKKIKLITLLALILIIPLLYLYGEQFISYLNQRRAGMYHEEYGLFRGITSKNTYLDINLDLKLIWISILSFLRFSFSPIFNMYSSLKFVTFLEIIIIYIFMLRQFYIARNENVKKAIIVWLIMFLVSFTVYGLAVFNDGSINRFRISLIFFILIGFHMHKSKLKEKLL